MDTQFNWQAAARAYDEVMKRDDDEALAFVQHVTYAVLQEDIARHRRLMDRHIEEVHKSIRRDLERVVSKSMTADPVAVLDEVFKAFGDDKYTRNQRGQFATVESRIRSNRNRKPMSSKQEKNERIPTPAKSMTPQNRAAYQQQYQQLREHMDQVSGVHGAQHSIVLRDRETGNRSRVNIDDLKHGAKRWDPSVEDLEHVTTQIPYGVNGAGFDLVSSLGGSPAAAQATQNALGNVRRGGSEFADRWSNADNDQVGSDTAQTYRRVQAGSQLLGQLNTGPGGRPINAKVAAAAKFGEFVGSYGPEAEKVVGPHMRKTNYRYRGIERKADPALLSAAQKKGYANARIAPDDELTGRQRQLRSANQPVPPTAEQQQVASVQTAMAYLAGRLPNLRLSEIQRKSGRIPPSEGVLINRDGAIVAQAVGHADDHYLPFNLKNLKSLNGGEYVRSRSKGGLTTEDIYTGLVSGARQVTVVSNSGVFTINFEDDFRGGRRYSDKAATMVDRYAKTLDAIKNGQIEREPLSAEVRGQLLDEVHQDMPPSLYSQADINAAFQQKVKDYKENPQLTSKELEDIDAKARAGAQLGTERGDREYRTAKAELTDAAMESKRSRMYTLDGQGYAAALDALKEQYPYYIKSVTYLNRNESQNALGERGEGSARFKGGSDEGYVAPRYNRPAEALEGYYDQTVAGRGSIAGTGKTPAAHTNYQNWEHNPVRRSAAKAPTEPVKEAEPERKPAPAASGSAGVNVAAAREARESSTAAAEAAYAGVQSVDPKMISREEFPLLHNLHGTPFSDRQDKIAQLMTSEQNRETLAGELDAFASKYSSGQDEGGQRILARITDNARKLRASVGPAKGFTHEQASKNRTKLWAFDGPGFAPGASAEAVDHDRSKAEKMAQQSPIRAFLPADAGSASELALAVKSGNTTAAAALLPPGTDEVTERAVIADAEAKNAKKYEVAAEGLHRLRTLNSRARDPKESSPVTSPSAPSTSSTDQRTPSTSRTQPSASRTQPSASSAREIAAQQPHQIAGPAPKKESFDDVLSDLDRMVGHENIKREVRTMANYLQIQQERKEAGLPTDAVGGHMVFIGNPGTGKTTVARMIGRLYAASGLLDSGHVVEVGRAGLVGEYAGQTAPKVEDAVDEAMGGVLFVDEAYTLSQDKYGQEAIDTLMTRMENDRGKFVVIAAGYDKNMDEFLGSNPGLRSRFDSRVSFEDYNPRDMGKIFLSMARKEGYKLTDDAAAKMAKDFTRLHAGKDESFANGRTVRSYFEAAKKQQANRLVASQEKPSKDELETLEAEDLGE